MEIKPIRTEADYKAALKEISPYFDNEPELGSDESDRFEILALLIEAYESKHFPIDLPDPIEAIKFRMEQEGLTAVQKIGTNPEFGLRGARGRIDALRKGFGHDATTLPIPLPLAWLRLIVGKPWGPPVERLGRAINGQAEIDIEHMRIVIQREGAAAPGRLFEVEIYISDPLKPRLCMTYVASLTGAGATFKNTGLRPLTMKGLAKAIRQTRSKPTARTIDLMNQTTVQATTAIDEALAYVDASNERALNQAGYEMDDGPLTAADLKAIRQAAEAMSPNGRKVLTRSALRTCRRHR